MITITIDLPEFLHQAVQEAAAKEGISINDFIVRAIEEKLTARERYDAALAQVPDVEPDEFDRIE